MGNSPIRSTSRISCSADGDYSSATACSYFEQYYLSTTDGSVLVQSAFSVEHWVELRAKIYIYIYIPAS